MNKVLYFDVETTGTDPLSCAIIQFAGLIEIDGEIADSVVHHVKPFKDAVISDEALTVTGVTRADLETNKLRISQQKLYTRLTEWFIKYVNKFDREDKLTPVGYNGAFDIAFLSELWNRHDDKYLGSFVDRSRLVDPLAVMRWIRHARPESHERISKLPNLKLETVCKEFGISIKAHDALSDILATRELVNILKGKIPC